MTEQPSAAPSHAPKAAGLAAVVTAAAIAVAPFTMAREGTVYRSYPDPGTKGAPWTICNGHTGPDVHPNMTATKAQCDAWFRADMTAKMNAVLRVSPELRGQFNPLKASGDFAFNAGQGRWPGSPMRAAFAKGQWEAGCNAFKGYMTGYRAPKAVPGRRCWVIKGKLYCELPGLVDRREREKLLCLTGQVK